VRERAGGDPGAGAGTLPAHQASESTMVAVLDNECTFRPMEADDLLSVVGNEQASYPYPWSRGIFQDCMRVGYCCLVAETRAGVCGHGIMMARAGEAHIMNLCVAPEARRRGIAREMLWELLDIAGRLGAASVFLEVRPSNRGAVKLYAEANFHVIGQRPGYYPARFGREDALVMARDLTLGSD